jgi:hypothetical protein
VRFVLLALERCWRQAAEAATLEAQATATAPQEKLSPFRATG